MKRYSFRYTALTALLALLTAGAVPMLSRAAGEGVTITGDQNFGVQQVNLNGSEEKFGEYRDIPNGFVLNDLRLKVDSGTTNYFLDLRIRDALQEDESYRLTGGVHGKYKFRLTYDQTPHTFASGTLLHAGAGNGYLSIANTLQSDLQGIEQTRVERGANPLVDTTTEDAQAQAIILGMYNARDKTTFKLLRKNTGFSLEYTPVEDVKTWASVNNERRQGTRVINAGTYERYAQGAAGITHTADLFLASGAELAEPIEYRTTTVSVGAGVYKEKWLADATYTFTDFTNENQRLIWDNPFRSTDGSATSATGAAAAAGDNGFERGRFVNGQLALAPDSKSHDVTISAAVELPLHGRLAATVGYGIITQDEEFVPYTLNSALNPTAPTTFGAGFDVTNPTNLPRRDLDGEVKTLTQSYVLTMKPLEPVAVTAKYRYYDYDNGSAQILFPGYAGFGESYWRTFKNDVAGTALDGKVINEPLSYTRQTAELGVDYHVVKPLTILVEGFWDDWDRQNLRIDSTTEIGGSGGIIYRPVDMASLKLNYKVAHRAVSGYIDGNTAAAADGTGSNAEASGLQNYDWADRMRNQASGRLQLDPMENLSLGLSGQYKKDKYGDDNRFGLKETEGVAGALDLSYQPVEILTLSANYVREYRRDYMQNGAKDDAFNSTSTIDDALATNNFNPLNYWNTTIHEKVDTVGVGATVQLLPKKLILDTSYSLSYSNMDFSTVNPNAAEAVAAGYASGAKLDNAVAKTWPRVRTRYHEAKADLGYRFTDNLKAGVTYLFEWYKQDDFAWDEMNAYMAGVSAENTTKYVFTGATYKDYEAHVGGVYVNYKF